jgi:very-short-patch-repair endonuclease
MRACPGPQDGGIGRDRVGPPRQSATVRPADHPATLRLLVSQHGLVTRAQLLALGWRADVVDGAVRNGQLSVVHRGVYRVPGSAQPPEQALLAAVLRAGDGARLTGEAVLHHLGIDEVGIAGRARSIVLVPPPRRLVTDPVPWRRDRAPDHDHRALGPIPATTAARAFVEVADRWRRRRQLTIVDQLRWRGHATEGEIVACAHRLGSRHPGARATLQLVASGHLEQESHGERDLAAALAQLGLSGLVRWQVWVSPLFRVDALIASHRVVLEYDGSNHHTHRRDRRRDASRDRELAALGYRVIHVTKTHLGDLDTLRDRLEEDLGSIPGVGVDGTAGGGGSLRRTPHPVTAPAIRGQDATARS